MDDLDDDNQSPAKRKRRTMTTSTPKDAQEEMAPISVIASKAKFADSLNVKQFDLIKDDPAI